MGQKFLQTLSILLQIGICTVQRLQNQIGRAGGAKKLQTGLDLCPHFALQLRRQVQIGAAGNHRQGLVGRITTQIGPQIHGMQGGLQKPQIGPVGVVHQQQHTVTAADCRKTGNIRQRAQIIRAGQIDRRGLFRCAAEELLQRLRADPAGQIAVVLFGIQPQHLQIQQGDSTQKGLVSVSCRCDQRFAASCLCVQRRQIYHGTDALGRTFGGIIGRTAKQGTGVVLALPNDAVGLVQAVGTVDLGNVQRLDPQKCLSFMSRHMKPQGVSLYITGGKIANGGVHAQSLSARATATMMAHSIRLRKSLQPYS